MIIKTKKTRQISSAFTLLLLLILSSCITTKNTNYMQKPGGPVPRYDAGIGYEEYILAPFDKVYIRLYSTDENTNLLINGHLRNMSSMGSSDYSELYTYIIDKNGEIDLPMVGKLHISGQYVREAKSTVKRSLGEIMIDEIAIDLRVMDRHFSVIGGKINGKYPIFREKMNIFQALAMAGDLSVYGDRTKIRILRESPTGHEIKVFDIRSKDIINSEYYYIQPNDVIYVQDVGSQFFSVTSLGSVFSTFFTTTSFAMLIYHLVKPAPEPIDPGFD